MNVWVTRHFKDAISLNCLSSWCQFHQHFMCAFCANILHLKVTKPNCNERKAEQFAFVQKRHALNVEEIDCRCQFHQHFKRRFYAHSLGPKSANGHWWLDCLFCEFGIFGCKNVDEIEPRRQSYKRNLVLKKTQFWL